VNNKPVGLLVFFGRFFTFLTALCISLCIFSYRASKHSEAILFGSFSVFLGVMSFVLFQLDKKLIEFEEKENQKAMRETVINNSLPLLPIVRDRTEGIRRRESCRVYHEQRKNLYLFRRKRLSRYSKGAWR
jgi:hypothetical protein